MIFTSNTSKSLSATGALLFKKTCLLLLRMSMFVDIFSYYKSYWNEKITRRKNYKTKKLIETKKLQDKKSSLLLIASKCPPFDWLHQSVLHLIDCIKGSSIWWIASKGSPFDRLHQRVLLLKNCIKGVLFFLDCIKISFFSWTASENHPFYELHERSSFR